MSKKLVLSFTVLLYLFALFSGTAGAEEKSDIVPGEILVVFKTPDSSQSGTYSNQISSINAIAGAYGVTLEDTYEHLSQTGIGVFTKFHTQKARSKRSLKCSKQGLMS